VGNPYAPYEILGEVGRGGSGRVYRARHVTLDRVVALKVLDEASASVAARFEREALAIARLRHPGIVEVHAAGTLDGLAGEPPFRADTVTTVFQRILTWTGRWRRT
jgi:serine/threonine protein kinase